MLDYRRNGKAHIGQFRGGTRRGRATGNSLTLIFGEGYIRPAEPFHDLPAAFSAVLLVYVPQVLG